MQFNIDKYTQSLVCGLMTGTSLDGIDVAFCNINSDIEEKYHLELLAFEMIDYPEGFSNFVSQLLTNPNWDDISFLNFALPQLYSNAIMDVATKYQINHEDIKLIGMHGQTTWHCPKPRKQFGIEVASTLQLGNGSALANLLSIPVISDFRSADVVLGGQGAPLVPRFDYDFFRSEVNNVICLNIGGMANITNLPKGCSSNQVSAFDTGPGNVLMNIAIQKYYGLDYDNEGVIARSGNLCLELFDELMNIEYIKQAPPKSTGRELFNEAFIDYYVAKYELEPRDLVTTFTHFTADSIAFNIRSFATVPDELIISGGGANNNYLVELLQKNFQNTATKKSDELGIPIDAKEAIAFAYLAWRSANGLPSNMPSVTGASAETVLGSWSMV